MKYAISLLVFAVWAGAASEAQSPLRDQALREAALGAGVVPLEQVLVPADPAMAKLGEDLFASTLLSLNGDMSCQTCHLDRFSSADGLPNAVGTGGTGEGRERLMTGRGDIVPRNALALWGRGIKGFDTFFWDGKVKLTPDGVASQFGASVPSNDPLVVAVHLPFVEIREMVVLDKQVEAELEHEDVAAATRVFLQLSERVRADGKLGPGLAKAARKPRDQIAFTDIAEAIAAFIRTKFAVRHTPFHDFLFDKGQMSEEAIRGGLIFYGKGRCSSCHSGPLMSDLEFHAMPFEQLGFGKNGFGVDYGRYNATLDPADMYTFRTPPLINVTRTGPYTHSGAIADLMTMIRTHSDPLATYDGQSRTPVQRREDLARLLAWGGASELPEPLSDHDINDVITFLTTLETRD